MVLCQTIFSSESFSYVVEIDKRETQEEELKVRLDKDKCTIGWLPLKVKLDNDSPLCPVVTKFLAASIVPAVYNPLSSPLSHN